MNVLPAGGVRVNDYDQDTRLLFLQVGLHHAVLALAYWSSKGSRRG